MTKQNPSPALKPFAFLTIVTTLLFSIFTFQTASAEYSVSYDTEHETHLDIDGARPFKVNVDGIDIVGEEVGPEKGIPTLVVGGLSSSYPYLRKYIKKLVAQGHRVFVYNPPGQGRGSIASGNNVPASERGMDAMLKVFPAVRHHVYETCGRRKVIVMGHSLGGFQIRGGSLGVVFDKNGKASISDTEKARAKKETGLIVPLFTLGIMPGTLTPDEPMTLTQNMLMSSVVPLSVECIALYNCVMPDPFSIRETVMVRLAVRAAQTPNNDFYAHDVDVDEVKFVTSMMMRQMRIERQISDDLRSWLKAQKYTTRSGLSLSDEWQSQQTGRGAIPSLYFGARNDGITPIEAFEQEADMINKSEMYVFENMGHMGPFLSDYAIDFMAKKIKARYKEVVTSCGKIFKKAS